MSNRQLLASLCAIAWLSSAAGPASATAEENDLQSKIMETWRGRAKSIQSLFVKWQSAIEHRKYERTVIEMNEFAFDKAKPGRARLNLVDVNNADPEDSESPMEVSRLLYTDDGDGNSVVFFPTDKTEAQDHPYASINPAISSIHRDVRWRPVQLIFMPFDADCGLWRTDSQDEFTVVEDVKTPDGTPSDLLQMGGMQYWFTSDDTVLLLGFRKRRLVVDEQGRAFDWISEQVTLHYEEEMVEGWIPSGWTRVARKWPGDIVSETKCRITHCRLNIELDDRLFQQKVFPHGTVVSDQRDGERVRYLVREGKPNRIFGPREGNSYYDEFLGSDR